MLQLPGGFLTVAGLQGEVQLAGQILLEILDEMEWLKGNCYRKTLYLMGRSMVSCRSSLEPIQ